MWRARRIFVAREHLESLPAMGLFKTEFTRFFTFGFAAGAVLVLASAGDDIVAKLAHEVIPVAEAQVTR